MAEEKLPFSNLEEIDKVSNPKLRFSQKNIIKVAEHEKNRGRYEESADIYKKVSDFLNSEACLLVMQNIETLLKLHQQQQEAKSKGLDQQNLKDLNFNNIPGINISIDNINFSGIELNGGEEAVKMLASLLGNKLSAPDLNMKDAVFPSSDNEKVESPSQEKLNKNHSPSSNKPSTGPSTNAPFDLSELPKDTIEKIANLIGSNILNPKSQNPLDFANIPTEMLRELADAIALKLPQSLQEGLSDPSNISDLSDKDVKKVAALINSNKSIQEILNRLERMENLMQNSQRNAPSNSQNKKKQSNESKTNNQDSSEESPEDELQEENPNSSENDRDKLEMQLNQKKDSEPIKIQQVGASKKVKKVKAVSLTYDFSDMFYNKHYFKFEDLFKEAGRLVKAKKLDEAIDIYNVLLDQKLPETMKMMIRQNVIDLKESIINTFKYSNTFFKVDEEGNAVAVGETDDSISVISRDHTNNDVYFKEE